MGKNNIVTKDGIVKETLMGGNFRVKLDDVEGDEVAIGILSGKLRKFHIRILPGDRVKMEFSPHDLTRGRIVYRYSPNKDNREDKNES